MIWSLQILRFVAALMVVYIHTAQTAQTATGSIGVIPGSLATLGLSGVDIFFVISGVIISRTARGLTWQEFAWKRFRRIIPIYYLVCIPAMLPALYSGVGWRDFVASFLLWPATDVMTAPVLGVAWTLCFEVLFYAAATLVLLDRRWLLVVLAVFASSLLLRPHGPVFQFLGNPIILEFMIGCAIAYAPGYRYGVWAVPLGVAALITAGLLGIAPLGGTMDFLIGEDAFRRVLIYGLPAALIVYGTMQVRAGRSFWTELGDASYSLYLTHTLLISPLLSLWMAFPLPPDAIILIEVLACVLFGWRIHVRFEKPILQSLKGPKALAQA